MTKWQVLRILNARELPGCPVGLLDISIECQTDARTAMHQMDRMVTDGLAYRDMGGYRATIKGRQLLEDTTTGDTTHTRSEQKWKNEALTGMKDNGARSEIINAALPTGKHVRTPPIEEIIDLKRRLISAGVTEEQIASGWVKMCSVCGGVLLGGEKCGGERCKI